MLRQILNYILKNFDFHGICCILTSSKISFLMNLIEYNWVTKFAPLPQFNRM